MAESARVSSLYQGLLLAALVALAFSCCAPPKFMGMLRTIVGTVKDGKPQETQTMVRIGYDRDGMRVSTQNFPNYYNPSADRIKLIWDYRRREMFTIVNTTCTRRPLLDAFREACIPVNSTLARSFYFGTHPYEYLDSRTYEMTNTEGMAGIVTVTEKDCDLVSETLYGIFNGVTISRYSVLLNQTQYSDDSFFIPPYDCPISDKPIPARAPWEYSHFLGV